MKTRIVPVAILIVSLSAGFSLGRLSATHQSTNQLRDALATIDKANNNTERCIDGWGRTTAKWKETIKALKECNQ
jgi:hypothetical protein